MLTRHTTTEEHRSKRKFQPSITSYFEVRDDLDDPVRGLGPNSTSRHQHHARATRQPQPQRERLAPEVPGQVQADLLNVGMRVRKSVPEGYKTHKKTCPMPSIQTTLSKPMLPTLDVKSTRNPIPDEFVHQRELLPFCGLHKIGGYAEQPTTNLHLYGGGGLDANPFPLPAEAFTQPFSSTTQESAYPTMSPQQRPHNPSKRSWQDDDDNRPQNTNFCFAMPNTKGVMEVDEVPVSPLSETPPPLGLNTLPPTRQFAKPKSRRPALESTTVSDEDLHMDFENETAGRVGSVTDFEEADFLAREVDMGGF
ncbi:hypothetical protein BDW02DRAFT_501502 [Decorospora gaudefroyi]|uniref:Uncharacterized protein n=1 Tax=Decorospora gaudefroyi TaxID=184978 RepID=A0A6A5KAU4_9PLEO|nr:hypothetical protein BDW02DRAFT_501502 [Decorospora gaudefroyi]